MLRTKTTLNQRAMSEELKASLASVLYERQMQDKKFGEQRHSPEWWLAILMEEVGELAETILHQKFGGPEASNMRNELVQVAAVSIAMLEHLNRENL